MRLTRTILYTCVIALTLCSCVNRNNTGNSPDIAESIRAMIGKQVCVPALTSTFLGRDSATAHQETILARLIVYYDSTSCQTCRVNNLYEWKDNPFIPSHQAYHTFLTDKDGRIILVGDPILNPDLFPLFLKTVNTIIHYKEGICSKP